MDDGNNAQILVHNSILGLANAPGLENKKRTKIMSAQIRLCLPTEFLLHHVYGADPACVEEETSSCSIMHGVFSRTKIQQASNRKRERQRRGRQAFKSSAFPRRALSRHPESSRGVPRSTSYQSVAELPSASPLDTPCPRLSDLLSKRDKNKFRVRK